jgi:signal transduction histidine kinase
LLPLGGLNRWLTRLGVPESPGETLRVERVLATGRGFLAVTALVAIYLDPTEPVRYSFLAYFLLLTYVVYSTAILAMLRAHSEWEPKLRLWIHAADILWPTLLMIFTEGPNSPFFLFFTFVLLSAAYRWGFVETVITAVLAVTLLLLEALLVKMGPLTTYVDQALVLNRFIMRSTYLLILGFLLGYLAETEKRLRAEIATIPRLLGKARVQVGLRGTLQGVLFELMRIFDSREALFAVREAATGRVFLWQAHGGSGREPNILNRELMGADRETYLFTTPAHGWYAARRRRGRFDFLAFDAEGHKMSGALPGMPEKLVGPHAVQSALVTTFQFGQEWMGRLYLLNPHLAGHPEPRLRFLESLVGQVSPAIYNVYLLRRMRSRAGAVERGRVARELHDGTIQSLIAAEMRLDVLRRKNLGETERVAEELTTVQKILHNEVLNLRELMHQLRPTEVDPRKLLEFMTDLVDKFRRETGIAVRFDTDLQELALPPSVSRDLARIVQEALVNVLKHSDARSVILRLTAHDGSYRLIISDDGRGFDFVGRISQTELESLRKGPRVIRERVRAIGGELTIESFPGRGARLEISFPQRIQG